MVTHPELNVARIAMPIQSLGPGRRVGLWVQGCTIGCAGCASTDTWNPTSGLTLSVDDVARKLGELLSTADGLTMSGGEPFQQPDALAELLRALRRDRQLDGRDVLIFTGYAAAAARRQAPHLWEQADAIVAGPYRVDRPGTAWLRSSDNQELVVLTAVAEERFSVAGSGGIDIGSSGQDLVMAGLPRPGDLDRFRNLMRERGVALDGVSWQS